MAAVNQTETSEILQQLLKERILVLDGAMGTMVHALQFTDQDFRGRQFAATRRT